MAKHDKASLLVSMRRMFIFFWVVVMSLTWFCGKYMGLYAQLFVTAWMSMLAFLGGVAMKRQQADIDREERHAQGLCLVCGYNLRGCTGRCPECGTMRVLCPHCSYDMTRNVSNMCPECGKRFQRPSSES